MKDNPFISVIIPTYNRLDYLTTCLESLRAQPYGHYEVIVVDDCSQDDMSPARDLCDVFLRNDINLGPAYGRNLAYTRSRGDILLFMDSDIVVLEDSLRGMAPIFQSDPAIGGVGGSGPPDETERDVRHIDGKSYDAFGRSLISWYSPGKEEKPFKLYDCHHLASAFLAVRRDVFEEIGGFDPYFEYMGEDRELCLRIKTHGYRVISSLPTRAIHFNSNEDNPEKDDQGVLKQTFYLNKMVEVAIKKDGLLGGVLWMLGNRRAILNRTILPGILKQFFKYFHLRQRRKQNFLMSERLEAYRAHRAAAQKEC